MDGNLYIGTGDGGVVGDPDEFAQDLGSLLGKILRIDVDGDEPYAIPSDNPFVGQEGAREEVWAYGFRNPFRFSFDRAGGRLFAGDVGDRRQEEIDIVERGGNYGWNRLEGDLCFPPEVTECDREGLTAPILTYPRTDGRSVTGGYVYRGAQETEVFGSYVFGDFVSGRIWSAQEYAQGQWRRQEIGRTSFLSGWGEDDDGELYVVHLLEGTLSRLRFGSRQLLPQVAAAGFSGGRITSLVLIANPTATPVSGTIEFRDSQGPRLVRVGEESNSSFAVEVPPYETRSLLVLPRPADPYEGWARLEADGPLVVNTLFSVIDGDEVLLTQAGIRSAEPLTRTTLNAGRNVAGGVDTGFALVNPSLEQDNDPDDDPPAEIDFRVVDLAGVTIAVRRITLAPRSP